MFCSPRLSSIVLETLNLSNAKDSMFMKYTQVFMEKSHEKVTRYLEPVSEVTRSGPQMSAWMISFVTCALVIFRNDMLCHRCLPSIHVEHTLSTKGN